MCILSEQMSIHILKDLQIFTELRAKRADVQIMQARCPEKGLQTKM